MLRKNFSLWMILLALGCMVFACKKDKMDPHQLSSKAVKLWMIPSAGNETINLDAPYIINGQVVNFSFLKFYVSNIQVKDDSGNLLLDNGGNPILVNTDGQSFNLGTITGNHVHELLFDVGLDSLTNHQDPITALAPMNDVEMHWNWNPSAGYKFFRMEGIVDGEAFQSHAASDLMYHPGLSLSLHDVDTSGPEINIVIRVDLAQMLAGIPLPATVNHGDTDFNLSYMNSLGNGTSFNLQ